jgi:hypothetical protein
VYWNGIKHYREVHKEIRRVKGKLDKAQHWKDGTSIQIYTGLKATF